VLGGRLVTGFEADPNTGAVAAVTARDVVTGAEEAFQADAVVSAIGITGGGLFWRLFGGWSGGLFGGGLGGLAF
jgi:glycerol-3-phosphate dehydrogenase